MIRDKSIRELGGQDEAKVRVATPGVLCWPEHLSQGKQHTYFQMKGQSSKGAAGIRKGISKLPSGQVQWSVLLT